MLLLPFLSALRLTLRQIAEKVEARFAPTLYAAIPSD